MNFLGFINNNFVSKEPVSTDLTETEMKAAAVTSTANVYNIANVGALYNGMPVIAQFDTASSGAVSVKINGGETEYPVVDYSSAAITSIAANGILSMRYNAANSNFMLSVERRVESDTYLASIGNSSVPFVKTTLSYNIEYSSGTFAMQPVSEDKNATISVTTPQGVTTDYPSGHRVGVLLENGQNVITIKVISGSDSRTYVLYVTH